MRPFAYQRPAGARAAVEAFTAAAGEVMYMGGGTNLADLMRLSVAEPELLIDVSRLPHRQVEERPGGGIRIGAAARNSDAAAHPLIWRRYPVLSQALLNGASGQIRKPLVIVVKRILVDWLTYPGASARPAATRRTSHRSAMGNSRHPKSPPTQDASPAPTVAATSSPGDGSGLDEK